MIIMMELEVEEGGVEDLREVLRDALDGYVAKRGDFVKFLTDNTNTPTASKWERENRKRSAGRMRARVELAERLGVAVRSAKYLVKAK